MDVNSLKSMINRMNPGRQENVHKDLWFKPTDKPTTIRILQSPKADIPFFEVYWHYDVGGERSVVCPRHYDGSPCPICDLADDFRSQSRGGGKADPNWRIFMDLQAKPRIYAPVLVRGAEDEGVKLWGFPQGILTYFVDKAMDPDWGDFTDPLNGRDVTVQILMPGTPGNPSTFKRPVASLKPVTSPILKDTDKIQPLLDSIPDYFSMDPSPFPIKTKEELLTIVKRIGAGASEGEIDTDDIIESNVSQSSVSQTNTTETNTSESESLTKKLDDLLS